MTRKSVLRREVKNTLATLSENDRQEKSVVIAKNLHQLLSDLQNQNPALSIKSIGLYAPLKDEVDILLGFIEEDGAKKNWKLGFPCGEDQVMNFRQSSIDDLKETQQFGVTIRTPRETAEEITPDILVIPGLAFTRDGHRLGRGKGYYDRYLADYKGLKTGICFQNQIFESVPHEEHDQLMDYVVTEESTFYCKNN